MMKSIESSGQAQWLQILQVLNKTWSFSGSYLQAQVRI